MIRKAKLIRIIAISVVIFLYLIPFYKEIFSNKKSKCIDLEITNQGDGEGFLKDAPYYVSNFVNQTDSDMMCHVSSIAIVNNKKLICTWYAGSSECVPDVAIYCSFFNYENRNWTKPKVLIDPQKSSKELRRFVRKIGNAVVMNDDQGRLWLFYSSMLGGWSTTSINYKTSCDEGKTWTNSKRLILSPFFNLTSNVKNKGIKLANGGLLIPCYHTFINKFSQMLFSCPRDEEPYFEMRKLIHSREAIQPAIVHQGDSNLAAFFRNMSSQKNKYILMAKSSDLGQTWSGLTYTSLPNPSSGFDMVTLTDGAYLGVINNSFENRSDLTLVISRDLGKTWKVLQVLENAPGKEYSYPSIIRNKQYYHITYTYERKRIKHLMFNEAWLKGLKEYGN